MNGHDFPEMFDQVFPEDARDEYNAYVDGLDFDRLADLDRATSTLRAADRDMTRTTSERTANSIFIDELEAVLRQTR